MANDEHVRVVKAGPSVIRDWYEKHPDQPFDLSGADLRGAQLPHADLSDANLVRANLQDANLSGANFAEAKLDGADLRRAELVRANLRRTSMREANLTDAVLYGADLVGAFLARADLTRADLGVANLMFADLANANLTEASLRGANMQGTELNGTDFTAAQVGKTTWATDLSEASGLEKITHDAPSAGATDAIARSRGRVPPAFLRGCGLTEWEILAARLYHPGLNREQIDQILYGISSLRAGAAIQISPLFISYSHADTGFVDALDAEFTARGIRFWRDIHQIKAGRVEKQLMRAISMNPTVVLVLSEHSVKSDWVEWEASKARELERKLGHDVLCPVAVDAAWKTCDWPGPLRRQIEDY